MMATPRVNSARALLIGALTPVVTRKMLDLRSEQQQGRVTSGKRPNEVVEAHNDRDAYVKADTGEDNHPCASHTKKG